MHEDFRENKLKNNLLDILKERMNLDYKVFVYDIDISEIVNRNLDDSFDNMKSIILDKVEDGKNICIFEEVTDEVWNNTHHLWIPTQFDYMYTFKEEIEEYIKEVGGIHITNNFELNYLGIIGIERYIEETILENEIDFYKDLQLEMISKSIINDEIKIDSEEKIDKILEFIEDEIDFKDYEKNEINIQDEKFLTENLNKFKEELINEFSLDEIEMEEDFEDVMEF